MLLNKEITANFGMDDLKDYCLHVLVYISEEAPFEGEQAKAIVLQTYSNNNVKGMKMLYKDINEWPKGLSKKSMKN